jgi:hypothetical protein
MSDKKKRQTESALWLLAVAVAIILSLVVLSLGPSRSGYTIMVVMLLALFGCLIQPMFQLIKWLQETYPHGPWWIPRFTGPIVIGLALVGFGFLIWPQVLTINPTKVIFYSKPYEPWTREMYLFTVTNRSEDNVYGAEFDFTIEDPSKSNRDFSIDIPITSRKPLGEHGLGAEKFADVMGIFCRDTSHRPFFVVSFERLGPHESREVTFTQNTVGRVVVSANAGLFWTEPQPISINGNGVTRTFQFSKPPGPGGCSTFSVLMDEKGVFWW